MNPVTMIDTTPASLGCRDPLPARQCTPRSSNSLVWRRPRVIFAISVALWNAGAALAGTYTLTQISPPPGAASSSVESVNNQGQVVGNTQVKAGRSTLPGPAFVWANGVPVSLPSLGADPAAQANGISDSGLIVGFSPSLRVYDPNTPPKAVWWQVNQSGGYEIGDWNALLPENSPEFLIATTAISKDGQFVVFDARNKSSGLTYPVVAQIGVGGVSTWPINFSGIAPVPAVPVYDGSGSDVHSDETAVRVVGWYTKTETDTAHPFIWEMDLNSGGVTMRDLDGNLNRHSFPEGVNGAGEIVGDISLSGIYQAHFWNTFGVKQQLPTLGGARSSASSINDSGLVTGWSSRSGKNVLAHAFLWDQFGGMRDLNALKSATDTSGIELTKGIKINNAGQILGYGVRKGVEFKVLLNPVP